MKARLDIDPALVRRDFEYDPEYGVLLRRSNGKPAGSVCNGYIQVRWLGRNFYTHRLAWAWMTGAWPKDQIDHANCVKSDNKWSNLREATESQNKYNWPLAPKNTSGFKGISWDPKRKKWLARISINGNGVNLGRRDTAEAAHALYAQAAFRVAGEFARVT